MSVFKMQRRQLVLEIYRWTVAQVAPGAADAESLVGASRLY